MANLTLDVKKWLTTLLQNLIALSLNRFNTRNCFRALPRFIFVSSAIFENSLNPLIKQFILLRSPLCLESIILKSIGCSPCSIRCNCSSQEIAPLLNLKRIKCHPDPLVVSIMDWFCRYHPTPSVHTLDIIDITSGDNIPTVCKFIQHLGSVLESLTISCYDHRGQIGKVQNKCISDPHFIDPSLKTFVSCSERRSWSIPSYFSSQYLL